MERENLCMYGHGKMWWRGEMIGKGSFGSVYLATHKKPKSRIEPFPTQMAVKSAKNCSSGSLRNEQRILGKLRDCPHVIKCYGEEVTKGKQGESVYNLLLEYASGGSLRNRMKKLEECKFPESEVKRYARSILLGIKSVHELGYAHRDIKPANVLLVPVSESEFTVKLCDFGMAKKVEKGNKVKYLVGTTMYLSPEAVAESLQEGPSDIWAVGCVVFELLTGKRVWDKIPHWNTKKLIHMIGHEFGVPEIPSDLSKDAKQFLKGCFVRKPEDRLSADMLLKLPFVDSIDIVGGDKKYGLSNSSLASFSDNDDSSCELVYDKEYQEEEELGDFHDDDEDATYVTDRASVSCSKYLSFEEYGCCAGNVDKEHEIYVENKPSVTCAEEAASVLRFADDDQHVLFVEDVPSICEYFNGKKHDICVEGEPSVRNYGDGDEDVPSFFEYVEGVEPSICDSLGENGDDSDDEEEPEYCYSQQDENSYEFMHEFKRRRVDVSSYDDIEDLS